MSAPVETRGAHAVALPALAAMINVETVAAESHARSAVRHALAAGALLMQAKTLVPHGEWQQWIVDNCTVSPRTASAYMRLASRVPELPAEDRQRVADLPLRDAVRAIGTPGDAPSKSPYWRPRPDAVGRISEALRSAAGSMRSAARDVELQRGLKAERLRAMRKRLQALLDDLDGIALSADQEAQG